MGNITFTKDANTFSFTKGRSFPVDDPASVNVITDYSEGRQLYAYDKGVQEKLINIVMEGETKGTFDNFEEWLTDIAVGPKNTFTYTDEDAINHTVRLLDTSNPLKEVSSGRYSGTIQLRKEV